MRMGVIFVFDFVDSRRLFRYLDAPHDRAVMLIGGFSHLEQNLCERVVDGRIRQLIPNVAKFDEKNPASDGLLNDRPLAHPNFAGQRPSLRHAVLLQLQPA